MSIILNSCQFPKTIDESSLKRIEEKPDNSELYGTWELDSFSYDYVSKTYSNNNDFDIVLNINQDNSFLLKNMPFYDNFGVQKYTKLTTIDGNWILKQSFNKKYWELKLDYLIYEKTKSMILMLFNKKDTGLVIWKFIGDPDMGKRLLFEKV